MKAGTGVQMKHKQLTLLFFAATLACIAATAVFLRAQEQPAELQPPFERMYLYGQLQSAGTRMKEIMSTAAVGATIPLFNYSTIASRDSNTYTGQMVGRSPFFRGHRTTSVKTFLIPVKFTFPSANVYDPTTNDGCTPTGTTVLSLQQGSPVFENAPADYVMNGVDVSDTQYVDAFERASFWSDVSGTPYHTVLSNPPTVTAVQNVTVPAASAAEGNGTCRTFGAIDLAWWDPSLIGGVGQGEAGTILANVAASDGVGPTDLPIFIFNSVVMFKKPISNCCILGYHNSFLTGGGSGPLQTYSISNFDTSGVFGGDIDTMSHEIGEWMDDPLGTNPTPAWGHIGQVNGCQNILEVGDPLSGTNFPSVTLGGFTYHPQELAFFSWFFGAPSIGAGGKFSDNGTFTGDAGAICF